MLPTVPDRSNKRLQQILGVSHAGKVLTPQLLAMAQVVAIGAGCGIRVAEECQIVMVVSSQAAGEEIPSL